MTSYPSSTSRCIQDRLERLNPSERQLISSLFDIQISDAHLVLPAQFHPWVIKHFGSLEAVEHQHILKTANLFTLEGARFNDLRQHRPVYRGHESFTLEDLLQNDYDPFCDPLCQTSEDIFGRIEGRYCITASNIAKFEGFHSLVIFKEHNPLIFSSDCIADYFSTGWQWAEKVRSIDPAAVNYFFLWNCLPKAGASIPHGHAQVSLGKGMSLPRLENWHRAAVKYRTHFGDSFFDCLYRAHSMLDLAFAWRGIRLLAYLTPMKDHETILFAPLKDPYTPGKIDDDLSEVVFRVLDTLIHRLGVQSFNLALHVPPIGGGEGWQDFPVIIRIVDRGDPLARTVDMGAMELYGASVIGANPYQWFPVIRGAFSD